MTTPNSKILLVDDSKFMRLANERVLARAGYEVISAADGEEGLRVAQESLPDLILLDLMLPKLSGPDVLRKLKADPLTAAIPVVVLTSLAQKNEGRLLQEGAVAYFEKSTLDLDKDSNRLVSMVESELCKINKQKQSAASSSG